jgi:hypothetical protein
MIAHSNMLERLDEMLALIDHCLPGGDAELVCEHVQQARTYWLGAMPVECRLNLDLAREPLGRMPETESRRAAQEILEDILRDDAEKSHSSAFEIR